MNTTSATPTRKGITITDGTFYSESQVDKIFTLAVYYFCDCYYKGKEAQRGLRRAKIGPWESEKEDLDNAYSDWVFDAYKEVVKAHVAEAGWPEGWGWTHDFWGAEGFFFEPGWNAPKGGGAYVGDSQNQIKWFSSLKALEESTEGWQEEFVA